MNNFFKEISKLYLKNKTKTKTNKNKKTKKKTTEKPEALIMVETDSLSFVLSCCSIPFYISGLIGNVLVIRIVHKTREMHTPTNYLLASMAVSDVFTIVTIAAQRFAFIPNAFSQEFDRINHVRSGCVGQRDSIINLAWKIHLIVFNALFLIRSVVMVFCYGSLIRGLYFTNTVCPENETTDGERSSEKKKLVITFLLATLGFLIGYVPCVAFHIVVAFQTNANIDINLYSHLQNAFEFLFSCSLCLNPLVYAFRSAHFREGFKRFLTTCWKPTPQATTG